MKKKFLFLLMLLTCITASADKSEPDFNVGDWAYDYNDDGISVTTYYKGSGGEVVIPSSVTYNGKTYSVTTIGVNAFYGCSGLTSLSIPNSVTSIGSNAFRYCSGLTSVTIPNSVTSIGGSAFYFCGGLTSVTIGNSVTSIGGSAFWGCSGLTEVTIPNSVNSIGVGAFHDCSSLKRVNIKDLAAWLAISFEIDSYGMYMSSNPLSQAHHLYLNGTEIKDLVIPNSVSSIGDAAFYGCRGLTSVTIPNSVTSIGEYAFSSCSGLTSVTIPSSVTNIGSYAFRSCSSLERVYITDLAAWLAISFEYEYLDLDSNTSNPLSKAHHLYLNDTEIKDLVIPNSVTSIGSSAFYGCSGLTSVSIPNSVTSIGQGAFYRCSGLTSVTIGNSVTTIGEYAFSSCSGLENIVVASDNPSYDSRDSCNAIIQKSRGALIVGCKTTIIPNSVNQIGKSAFSGCSGLTEVTIPNSINTIGEDAFYGCSGLADIYSEISNPTTRTTASNAFAGVPYTTCKLHVPADTKHMYQVTTPWNNFVNTIEGEGADPCDVNGDGVVDIFDVNAVINRMLGVE